MAMFSILSRSIPRRTVVGSVRFVSQKPPVNPGQPRKKIKPTPTEPAPETAAEAPTATPESVGPTLVSGVPTLDFSPPEFEKEFQRTGARSSKGSLSSNERKRRFMGRVSLVLLAVGFGVGSVYLGREWEEVELKEKKLRIEDAPSTRWGRTTERFIDLFDYFNKPAWPELLPPPYPPPHQKPYTLLISLDDLLITSTWDRQNGWRTAKRPGVDYFLGYVSQFYEVVIFTTQPSYTAAPVLDKLDRYGFYINYRLYREATRAMDGKIVKDLSYLNRDLSKVIMLDTDPEHVITHPENAVIVPKWKGDPKDKDLVGLIPFLESVAIYKPADIRPIMKAYAGKNVAIEYGKLEAEMKTKHIAEWQSKNKDKVKAGGSGVSFGSFFGLSDSVPAQPRNVPPPTYLEQKRAEAQKQYLAEMKYIQDNREELDRLLEQDQQAMAAQVPGSLWEVMDSTIRGKPPGGDAPPQPGAHPGAVATSTAATTPGSPPSSQKTNV